MRRRMSITILISVDHGCIMILISTMFVFEFSLICFIDVLRQCFSFKHRYVTDIFPRSR